jgi:hypothetical protein
VEPDSAIAPALVTPSTGSLLAVSQLENVWVAKVDGFYRFPVWSKYSTGRFSARSRMMYGHHAK